MKILFLSDTHLGFDLPFKPRVQRRRRGPDFFRMFEMALEPAFKGDVDAVIHGGDILFRSKVPPQLVQMAFEPLQKLADTGMPVYIVPGNHERSHIPYRLFATHPNIHIFTRPRTFILETKGFRLALAGFPYIRDNIRQNFPKVFEETGVTTHRYDAALLCIHHCVEGSAIKQGDKMYVFRSNTDVIKIADLQLPVAAVLSGHIHRFQVVKTDLTGTPVPVHIFYPGSVERTSFVEKDEPKGYLIMEIEKASPDTPGGKVARWQFHELPARPMYRLSINGNKIETGRLRQWLIRQFSNLPEDSVVQIRVDAKLAEDSYQLLSAGSLRSLAPETMNISVSYKEGRIVKGSNGVTERRRG